MYIGHGVIVSQRHRPLFQLAALFRPDVGRAVLIVAQERAADTYTGSIGAGVQLNVQVLAQHQAVGGVQLHIEGIPAGGGHFVRGGTVVAVSIAALGGIFVVHQRDGARPRRVLLRPGHQLHPVPLLQAAPLQFAQHTLDPVGAGLLDGDVSGRLAVRIGGVIFVDFLHPPGDGGSDGRVVQQLLRLLHLVLLGLQLQLRFLLVHLSGLNLHGVLQLGGAGKTAALPFQCLDFFLVALNAALQLLQLQIFLVQIQL